MAIAMQ